MAIDCLPLRGKLLFDSFAIQLSALGVHALLRMSDRSNADLTKHEQWIAEHSEFLRELERVCPEAANGLAADLPLPMLSQRDRIRVLRGLSSNAGVSAFIAAGQAFAAANPAAVIRRADT